MRSGCLLCRMAERSLPLYWRDYSPEWHWCSSEKSVVDDGGGLLRLYEEPPSPGIPDAVLEDDERLGGGILAVPFAYSAEVHTQWD